MTTSRAPAPRAPAGLAARGRRLWREMHEAATFNPGETVLLEEACRTADRLDRLDRVLTGDREDWFTLREQKGSSEALEIVIDSALSEARQQANVLKQLIAALRVPDEASGKKPQRRGPRGAYQSKGAGSVSSLDRARKASGS